MLSLPAWGEWIEIVGMTAIHMEKPSLPAWGEWIEMFISTLIAFATTVSPRMGRVD